MFNQFAPIIDGLLISISKSSMEVHNISIRSYIKSFLNQPNVAITANPKQGFFPQTPPKQSDTSHDIEQASFPSFRPHTPTKGVRPSYRVSEHEMDDRNLQYAPSKPTEANYEMGAAITLSQLETSHKNKSKLLRKKDSAKSLKLVLERGSGLTTKSEEVKQTFNRN